MHTYHSRRQKFCCRSTARVEQRVFYRKMSRDDVDHAQGRVECRQRGTSVLFIGVPDMQSGTPLVSVLAANGRP